MEKFFTTLLGRNKLSTLLALGRPWNGVLSVLLMVIGVLFGASNLPNFLTLILASLAIFILYMAGAVINDIYDFNVDNVNMPYRPLQNGNISMKLATYYALLLYFISVALSLMVSFQYFIVILLILIISILYSMPPFSLKNRHLIGNVSLSISTVMLSLISGFVLARGEFFFDVKFICTVLFFTASIFFINLSKDFKDIQGDKKFGKTTAVLKYGANRIIPLVLLGEVLLFVTIAIFYFVVIHNILFLLTSTILMALLFGSFYMLYKDGGMTKEIAEKVWSYERIIITFIVINILIFLSI